MFTAEMFEQLLGLFKTHKVSKKDRNILLSLFLRKKYVNENGTFKILEQWEHIDVLRATWTTHSLNIYDLTPIGRAIATANIEIYLQNPKSFRHIIKRFEL